MKYKPKNHNLYFINWLFLTIQKYIYIKLVEHLTVRRYNVGILYILWEYKVMAEIRIPLNLMLWGVRVPTFPKYSHEHIK